MANGNTPAGVFAVALQRLIFAIYDAEKRGEIHVTETLRGQIKTANDLVMEGIRKGADGIGVSAD